MSVNDGAGAGDALTRGYLAQSLTSRFGTSSMRMHMPTLNWWFSRRLFNAWYNNHNANPVPDGEAATPTYSSSIRSRKKKIADR